MALQHHTHSEEGADYAIGDIQGCYDSLQRLLDHIQFDERRDRLWLVGDIVNRGPQSLAVLRFLKSLPLEPRITLGNHDLHLLGLLFNTKATPRNEDTLQAIFKAPDRDELGHWLRHQHVLYLDTSLNVVMTHAGIPPIWNLAQAKKYAVELEHVLKSDAFVDFLSDMYGNKPEKWSDELSGIPRWRLICNYFTRMRYCHADGRLALGYKKDIQHAPKDLYPWYATPGRWDIETDIVFGHWAALNGECPHPHIYAIDTGCVWGRHLTALRLQDKRRFSIGAQETQ